MTKAVVTLPIEAPVHCDRSDHLSVVVDGIGHACAEIIRDRVDGAIGSSQKDVGKDNTRNIGGANYLAESVDSRGRARRTAESAKVVRGWVDGLVGSRPEGVPWIAKCSDNLANVINVTGGDPTPGNQYAKIVDGWVNRTVGSDAKDLDPPGKERETTT
jgi:hypothetical protein